MTTTIREHRRKKGLKQAELAELVGVRRETIGNLERGKYTINEDTKEKGEFNYGKDVL